MITMLPIMDYTVTTRAGGVTVDTASVTPLAGFVKAAMLTYYVGETAPVWTSIDSIATYLSIELCRDESYFIR